MASSSPHSTLPEVNRPATYSGRKVSGKGYVLIYQRSHPKASNNGGYVFEHRLVMEEMLGRYLTPGEVVHHKNGSRGDNRLQNLELMEIGKHTTSHHTGMRRSRETCQRISARASARLSDKRKHPEYRDISEGDFKKIIRESSSISEVCSHYSFTKRTFYNKLKELGIREWYFNGKS